MHVSIVTVDLKSVSIIYMLTLIKKGLQHNNYTRSLQTKMLHVSLKATQQHKLSEWKLPVQCTVNFLKTVMTSLFAANPELNCLSGEA